MVLIITCLCGKSLRYTKAQEGFTCPQCKRTYVKDYFIQNGEYQYTYKLKTKKTPGEGQRS